MKFQSSTRETMNPSDKAPNHLVLTQPSKMNPPLIKRLVIACRVLLWQKHGLLIMASRKHLRGGFKFILESLLRRCSAPAESMPRSIQGRCFTDAAGTCKNMGHCILRLQGSDVAGVSDSGTPRFPASFRAELRNCSAKGSSAIPPNRGHRIHHGPVAPFLANSLGPSNSCPI